SNPIPVTIDDKSDPILTAYTAPTTAEICSGKDVWQLWESPCDNDEVSIQRYHEYCLNDPWGACLYDDRYENARHESCLNNPFPTWCVEDGRYDDVRHEHCLNNPFDTGCAGDDRYQDARTAEICSDKDAASLWQSPCDKHEASIQRRDEYCLNDPFDTGCANDDRYKDARTAEICSGKDTLDLWENPCDQHEASIQRFHEYCLTKPFSSGCQYDDRYNSVRIEACTDNFSVECLHAVGVEIYALRIKLCNNPANAGHDACVAPSEAPHLDPYGYSSYFNQFLQGTADGLNTGWLRTSSTDESAPVVHILKLSDSDDGVAFFAGVRPRSKTRKGKYYNRFYAGILPDPDLGAPITQTGGTAVWQGTFSVITSSTYESDIFRTDTDFDLEIDFAKKQLSASIRVENKYNGNDLDLDYRLSGAFADGKIEGRLQVTDFRKDRKSDAPWDALARVQGLIGQDGAVAAFIGNIDGIYYGNFSGGFVARPPSK
ncbi:MAG: hypothetical protein K8953_05085, partial [Proteobacteria bacterium]|nr:hypothetical protein [Pseudomonadota bacterium]